MTPCVTTARLLLRPHRIEDFGALAQLWGNPEVTRFIGGHPATREESWARLLRYFGLWPALGFGYFAVLDRETGAYLGDVGLADFKREITPPLLGMAEAGWALTPAAWGRGIASEALAALLGWYRGTTAPRPVACVIAPGNLASRRVAIRCGFVPWTEASYRGQPTCLMRLP